MKALTPEEMANMLLGNMKETNDENSLEAARDEGLSSEELKLLFPDLTNIFAGSIRQANMDIKMGANPDEIFELTILNFITRSVISGYGKADIEEFLTAYLGKNYFVGE